MTKRKDIRFTLKPADAEAFERAKAKAENELGFALKDGEFAARVVSKGITNTSFLGVGVDTDLTGFEVGDRVVCTESHGAPFIIEEGSRWTVCDNRSPFVVVVRGDGLRVFADPQKLEKTDSEGRAES